MLFDILLAAALALVALCLVVLGACALRVIRGARALQRLVADARPRETAALPALAPRHR